MADRSGIVEALLRSAGAGERIGAPLWAEIREVLSGVRLEQWLEAFAGLDAATPDRPRVAPDLARATPRVARHAGPDAPLELARTAGEVARRAGSAAAASLLAHAPRAALLSGGAEGFRIWLASLAELAAEAPQAVQPVCVRTDMLLGRLDPRGFRAWLVAGLGRTGPEARLAWYAQTDAAALEGFGQEAGEVRLETMEKRLRALVTGLWGHVPVLRPAVARKALHVARRASFDGPMIRLPPRFPGFPPAEAEALFKAAVAHAGAHHAFSRGKFEPGSLKPIQIALVSLIEDARVELLAGRRYPGLLRLWKRFHIAGETDGPAGPNLAGPLLARLARALIDPGHADDNPWIVKARALFAAAGPDYDDPAEIRRIGVLLGNDLGQMRIQFNARTHVVQPPYRDDNLGLWDFGPPPPEAAEETETVFDSFRLEQTENPEDAPDRSRERDDPDAGDPAGRVRPAEPAQGVPVAQYPEWDYLSGRLRQDWTTLVDYDPPQAVPGVTERILEQYADTERRIEALVRQARVGRPVRLRRQAEGDRLDLDAAIRVAADRRAGLAPETRVYETTALLQRDLSVLVLLDISESTKDTVRGGTVSVFSLERAAMALLAEAMAGVGDPFALHAFASDGRSDVHYTRIKDFGRPYDGAARARLGGLRPGLSTRLGAALRHAGAQIAGQQSHRRLILVITDGEPSDIDVDDRRYLAEDARKAVHELGHQGIDTFCVALTGAGDDHLSRIFGRRHSLRIANVEALPEKLPMLYFRLTA